MTHGEEQALSVAKRYFPGADLTDMVKTLASQTACLAMAIESMSEDDVKKEVGYCAFILLHVLSTCRSPGLITEIVLASERIEKEKYQNQTLKKMSTDPKTSTEKELTLGQKRVGVTFNPSQNVSVELFKQTSADLIDMLEEMRQAPEATSETQRVISRAQSFYEDACMNAVKAHFAK